MSLKDGDTLASAGTAPWPLAAMSMLVAALLGLATCGGSSRTPVAPSTPPPAQFTLSGTVYNLLLGSTLGVPGATLQITGGINSGRSATTDRDGKYRFDGLAGGSVTMQLSAPNYQQTSRQFLVTADGSMDFGLTPTVVTTTGRVVDAVSQAGVGGVAISGGPLSVQSDAGGVFQLTGPPGSIDSPLALTFTSPFAVVRQTSLRVPGRDAVVSLISSSFDLTSFDDMFRTPKLLRWTTAPPLTIETRSGQFVDREDDLITTIGDGMSDAEYASMLSDLTVALSALSGNTFTTFASVTRQDSPPGAVVTVLQTGTITVMRVRGMEAAIGAIGLGNWLAYSDGTVVGGMVLLDRDYDQNCSGYAQQVRQHELGHALGYHHVTTRDSVMNPTTGPRAVINDADRLGARIAFQRPPGNRTPDIDPSDVAANLARFRIIRGVPERQRR